MKTQCPDCNSLYPITEDHLGRSATCKKCGSRFVVRAFEPAKAIIEDPVHEPEEIGDIPQKIPRPSPEPPTGPPPAKKKKNGRGAFVFLTLLLLVVIAVLSVLLWKKMDEITALKRERSELSSRINELQSKEKLRKTREQDTGQIFDFRLTRWGMTKNNVMASHGRLPDDERSDAIEYGGELMGKEALITYGFQDGRLIRARYDITEKYPDPGEYLTVYDGLKVILEKKYGPPVQDTAQWRDKPVSGDRGRLGRALAEGQVTFLSQWETKRTTIKAVLGRKNGEITCMIEYLGKIMSPPGSDAGDSSPSDV